ncbi:MAG TPA: carboxylesterase family protein, partial [Rhizomicrobium sp.]|nr:carboxylesterase family protein [Rhizomicrobium sp.]
MPAKPWKGIYNADSKITNCYIALRATTLNHYFGEIKSSEECLYVNIWAPPRVKNASAVQQIRWRRWCITPPGGRSFKPIPLSLHGPRPHLTL